MDLKFIKYEKRNHIAYITFNRPERMNALHPPVSRRDGQRMGRLRRRQIRVGRDRHRRR